MGKSGWWMGAAGRAARCRRAVFPLLILVFPLTALGQGPAPLPGDAQLGLINRYYLEGEAFRAESELLRFLHEHPSHPRRGEAELLRAKLHYREGRFGEATLMLFSQLDRFPRGRASLPAARLLTFSLVREGRLEEAQRYLGSLREPGEPPPSLEPLQGPPPDAVDPDTAVAWSTWLPGTGFFALGEPGKAFAGMGLNLFFTAAAYFAFDDNLPAVGLVFLIAEIALYRGGREAVREAAEQQLASMERERREAWTKGRGEAELLGVGIQFKFGGS